LAPGAGLEVLSNGERELHRPAKSVGHISQPLVLALGGFCHLDDDTLSFPHDAIIEHMFGFGKRRSAFLSPLMKIKNSIRV
jgi:hypothetical protein